MSMIEWKEQEDGTFQLCIPDAEAQKEFIDDYQYDQEHGSGIHFGYTLLEEMHGNSEYVLTTPLDIYLQSLQSMGRIMARGGSAHSAQCAEYAAHPNDSSDGWKMGLMPDQPLIAIHDLPDDGVITQVDKIWLLPEGWLADMLAGKNIIAHPAPTTRDMQAFLDNLARQYTPIHWDEKGPGFELGCSHQGNRYGGYMYGKKPTEKEFKYLIDNKYITLWNGSWDSNHYLRLTEKGLLATGRTLVDTYLYQQEYTLDMMENNMFMRDDRLKIWAIRENIRKAEEIRDAESNE